MGSSIIQLKEILKRRVLFGNQTVVLLINSCGKPNSRVSNPSLFKKFQSLLRYEKKNLFLDSSSWVSAIYAIGFCVHVKRFATPRPRGNGRHLYSDGFRTKKESIRTSYGLHFQPTDGRVAAHRTYFPLDLD